MNYGISDSLMKRYVERWIRDDDNVYTLDDVMKCIRDGAMQSHVFGDTWVLTSIRDFPQRRAVHIDLVVGQLHNALAAEPRVCDWAREQGATLITGSGRPGWDPLRNKVEGWRMKGYLYSKEL